MDTPNIVEHLTQQRDRVVAAIQALTGGRARRGPSAATPRKRRKMSPAAKRKLSLAAKRRWAKAKRAGRNAL